MTLTTELVPNKRGYLAPEGAVVLTPSTISSMNLCPAAVGYSQTDGYLDVPSEQSTFGTTAHNLIEAKLAGETDITILNPAGIEARIAAAVEGDGWTLDMLASDRLTIDRMVRELQTAYTRWLDWWDRVGTHLDVRAIEQKRSEKIGEVNGREVWLAGTADVVTGGGIIDWKTATSGWKDGRALASLQAPLYAWLNRDHIDLDGRDHVRCEYLVYNRKKAQWESHQHKVTISQIETIRDVAFQYGAQIAHGIFPPTPTTMEYGKGKRGWYCSAKWCNAWNVCDWKGMVPDGVDLDEPRVVAWPKAK